MYPRFQEFPWMTILYIWFLLALVICYVILSRPDSVIVIRMVAGVLAGIILMTLIIRHRPKELAVGQQSVRPGPR